MATFKAGFEPALNKDGYARLTFKGYSVRKKETEVTDKETGEKTTEKREFITIDFDCLGKVRGTDKEISIATNFDYTPETQLGLTLTAMGFNTGDKNLVVDEEGFEVQACEEDEDGFEVGDDISTQIETFLNEVKGKVYIAKVAKDKDKKKGYYVIDVETLKLFKK
ncbi:hypothetical protein NIES2101_41860 [Calothrix sp. HK-06]|nr:hypothetical protein NIES2101_41860 [Calothrix sp. HK-06]